MHQDGRGCHQRRPNHQGENMWLGPKGMASNIARWRAGGKKTAKSVASGSGLVVCLRIDDEK